MNEPWKFLSDLPNDIFLYKVCLSGLKQINHESQVIIVLV